MFPKIITSIIYLCSLLAATHPICIFSQVIQYEMQKVTVKDRQANDWFGFAASISGEYAISAAPMRSIYKKKETLHEVGVVYVFKKNNEKKWVEIARIDKPKPEGHDLFGYGISKGVSIYNRTIVIGGKGTVYVYEIDAKDKINFIQKLNSQPFNSSFGEQVSLNANFLVVANTGSNVNIYSKAKNKWQLHQIIQTIDKEHHLFAKQLALSEQNSLIVSSGTTQNAEMISYQLSSKSNNFEFLQKIKYPNTQISSVAVTEKYLALGLSYILLYKKDENGQWEFQQKIETNAKDGMCISLTNRYLLVGTFGEKLDDNGSRRIENAGAGYLFENTEDTFIEIKKYTPVNREAWDKFGFSVCLTESDAIISSRFEKEDMNEKNSLEEAGAIYFISLIE